MEAIILKITANQIIVWYNNQKHQVFAPGKWKYETLVLRPGDKVKLGYKNHELQIIEFIARKNFLNKPKVANLDNLIIIASYVQPNLDWIQLLKTMAFYEYHLNLCPYVVITKTDLNQISTTDWSYINDLKNQNYVILIKQEKNTIQTLKNLLVDHISAFVGQSGVGKSTLINNLNPQSNQLTNVVSSKLKRGKNTTTQTELLPFCNGFLIDTPGYSKFQNHLTNQQLSEAFHVYASLKLQCKFPNCLHFLETDCQVKTTIKNKLLPQWQYDIYLLLQKQLKKTPFFN